MLAKTRALPLSYTASPDFTFTNCFSEFVLCACLCVKWLGQRTTLCHPLPLWSSLLSEPRAHYPVRLAARDPSSLLSPLSHSAEVRGVKGTTPILLTWERSKHSYSATYISSLSSLLMLRQHFMSTWPQTHSVDYGALELGILIL